MIKIFGESKIRSVGLVTVLIVSITALLSHWITPYDYAAQNIRNINGSPMTGYTITTLEASDCHWYGTSLEWGCTIFLAGSDDLGRDIFSRLIYGIRTSLTIGFSVAAVNLIGGTTYGLISAYCILHTKQLLRFLGYLLTILIEFLSSVPSMVFMLLLILYFHNLQLLESIRPIGNTVNALLNFNLNTNGLFFVFLAISSPYLVHTAKLAKNLTVSAYKTGVMSNQAGSRISSIAFSFRETLRAIKKTMIMFEVSNIPVFIFTEVAFGFLGFGILPPTPSLGRMLNDSYPMLRSSPYHFISITITLFFTVVGFNLITYDFGIGIKSLSFQNPIPQKVLQ